MPLVHAVSFPRAIAVPRMRPVQSMRSCVVRAAETASASASTSADCPITLSEKALSHLQSLKAKNGGGSLLLRMGVRSGGCSGMSYIMDFEKSENITADDLVFDYEGGFKMTVDSKSLLYLFGMQLDYSDELIGGGFKFTNPNAKDSCGCGKSFGV